MSQLPPQLSRQNSLPDDEDSMAIPLSGSRSEKDYGSKDKTRIIISDVEL